MFESDGGKRSNSFIEDEEIVVKPSTELIPDEYERTNNESVLVELVCRQTDQNANDFWKQLKNLGFAVNITYTDRLSVNENWVTGFASKVNEKTKEKNYEGLLMIFAKVPLRNEVLKTVWSTFSATNCPALKNKPKIFIFQILKRAMHADSRILLQTDIKTAYDTPTDADILIIYDKFLAVGSSNDFLENFHDHIKDYGHQEDIVNLVSLTIGSDTRPLVISTMTRKFFFTLSKYRGHHHNINESHTAIKEDLEKISTYIKNMPDHKPKERENKIMSSFRKTINNLMNKNNGENKARASAKPPPKITGVKQGGSVADSSKKKPNTSNSSATGTLMPPPSTSPASSSTSTSPISTNPTRRTSTSSIPVSPNRRTPTRTRIPSNSFNSKEDLSKKPPWK